MNQKPHPPPKKKRRKRIFPILEKSCSKTREAALCAKKGGERTANRCLNTKHGKEKREGRKKIAEAFP